MPMWDVCNACIPFGQRKSGAQEENVYKTDRLRHLKLENTSFREAAIRYARTILWSTPQWPSSM